MKKNVGNLDAYIRITAGLTLFGCGILKNSKSSMFLGSMKVAEGITRFCPMLYIMGMSTDNNKMKFKLKQQ
ncbi:DUF2892 domain-containing protein [Clostridium sp. D2Q-14]|uniref:YgaP family membrane protein n=1 Tax=Anaeromonas gelatinilytica TaxID=2683194 RepID=UPI00193C3A50|nr:DUF2892 domain-containing protein [Anaeromonas gelatinilytica]MBS4536583.1 DUF2892 domain-containing protein [Anaeromonas gelatinilytica]